MQFQHTPAVLLAGLLGAASLWAQTPPPPGRGNGRFGPGPENQNGARFLGAQAGAPGRVIKNAPYSAEVTTETTQTLPDGNHIHQVSTSKVYRDSEGRTRTEQSLTGLGAIVPNNNLPTVIFLQDPVAGTSYALDITRKTATKSAWPRPGRGPGQKGPGGRSSRPADDNVKSESLGRQTVAGVPAEGTRSTVIIPAGQVGNEQPIQIVTERWYSPDLQIFLMTRHSDPRAGETVTRLASLSRAEPAHSLFEVPADFKVTEETRPARTAPPSK
jgi:hypothetical protein